MSKNVRLKVWIGLLIFGLVSSLGGWHFRYEISGLVRWVTLPHVQLPEPGTIRFVAIGDYGSGSHHERDVALVIDSWTPDFVVTLGDNNYEYGSAETIDQNIGQFFHQYISPYKGIFGRGASRNRFFPIPGHRDWDGDSLRPYLDYFTLPGNERYYDLVWGPVHLFMLDTDEREPDGVRPDSIQGRWLEQQLKESTQPWNLVLAHHAPYTSHKVEDIHYMRWPFKAWGADAVLSGFFHIYERLIIDGLPYFVNGAGGLWVSEFGEIDSHSEFRYREDFGFMVVDVNDSRIIFRFVNRQGEIIDRYELDKHEDGEARSKTS